MLTFGLVVEGVYDASALTEFIKKCVGDNTQVVQRPCGSKMGRLKMPSRGHF
jgi:hypothetical protein